MTLKLNHISAPAVSSFNIGILTFGNELRLSCLSLLGEIFA